MKGLAALVLFVSLLSFPIVARADDAPAADLVSGAGYSTVAIDPSATKLPNGYMGQDPAACFVNIVHKVATTKGEFETTEAYNARLAKLKTAPVVGSLSVGDVYAFKLMPDIVSSDYDADKQILHVRMKATRTVDPFDGPLDDMQSLELKDTAVSVDQHDATNGFGAQTTVTEAKDNEVDLLPMNIKAFKLSDTDDYKTQLTNVPLPLSTAPAVKPNIAILAIGHLQVFKGNNYIGTLTNTHEATFSNPYQLETLHAYLIMQVDQFWVFNTQTGDVYAKVAPK